MRSWKHVVQDDEDNEEHGHVHNCDTCDKQGQCPIEALVRRQRATGQIPTTEELVAALLADLATDNDEEVKPEAEEGGSRYLSWLTALSRIKKEGEAAGLHLDIFAKWAELAGTTIGESHPFNPRQNEVMSGIIKIMTINTELLMSKGEEHLESIEHALHAAVELTLHMDEVMELCNRADGLAFNETDAQLGEEDK